MYAQDVYTHHWMSEFDQAHRKIRQYFRVLR